MGVKCENVFFAPEITVPPEMKNILTIKNAPAQKRQEREFLVCRNDEALAVDWRLPALALSKDSMLKKKVMKEKIFQQVGFVSLR